MDSLYNDLINEVLVSDISTKGWREFIEKYTPQAHRKDLFVQFTNFASSPGDKRLVGALSDKPNPDSYTPPQWEVNKRRVGARAARTPEVDLTLWTKPTHGDPTAIYTYPLEFVISEQAGIPYAFNSRYLRVIKLRPGAKVLDLQTVTKPAAKLLLQAMDCLPQMPFEEFWHLASLYSEQQYAPNPVTPPKVFFFAAQHRLVVNKTIGETWQLRDRGTLSNNEQRARFLKAGITVVQDTAKSPQEAVVFHGEPEQAFFMRSDAFDIVDAFTIAKQKKGEYNPTVWHPDRGARKVVSRIVNSIDPRDKIIRMGPVHGGVQAFIEPLPLTGKVLIGTPLTAVSKRGRIVSADIKMTDKEEVPGKPKHRQEGQHLRVTTNVSAYSEGGKIDYSIGRDQTLDDGVNHIAKLAHAEKPRSEWKPIRGVDPRASVWREALLVPFYTLITPSRGKPEVDLDHLLNQAPHVMRGLEELFGMIDWNWKAPTNEWEKVGAWIAASKLYASIKRVYQTPTYLEGMSRVLRFRDAQKKGEETPFVSVSDIEKLEGSKVYGAAKALMVGSCAEGFYHHEHDDLLNGIAELFERRWTSMVKGSFANFNADIGTDMPKLLEVCADEGYEKELKEKWDDICKEHLLWDRRKLAQEFKDWTGQQPQDDWQTPHGDEVNEMIIGRNFDPPTPQRISAPPQSISKQNPIGKLSPDVTFQNSRKPAVVKNPKMAAARRAVEKAVKRTLSWATDHNTGSATAYIGNGRKVRIGGDRVSVGPRVTPLNINRMPSDEQLAQMLA